MILFERMLRALREEYGARPKKKHATYACF